MAAAMAPAVLLRAALATIGRFPALAGVDLELAPGELAVLEGPNGAGKTSVLRACAGLLALTGGEGVVLGHDLRRHASAVRGLVGYLGHASALYDELTVAENLRFSLRAVGAPVSNVPEVLDRAGLGGRLARTAAGKLSAGQRRRAALAAVMARRPALWLLDEPHAALDADGRRLLTDVVTEALSAGSAVLVASHEPAEVVALADRVLTMAGGRVQSTRRGGRRRVVPGQIHVA
jgi:heme ABC exporter ATP-binding subunit CcmA